MKELIGDKPVSSFSLFILLDWYKEYRTTHAINIKSTIICKIIPNGIILYSILKKMKSDNKNKVSGHVDNFQI